MANARRKESAYAVKNTPSSKNLFVDTNGVEGTDEVSYKRTPIPTAAETRDWVKSLNSVPPDAASDVAHSVDLAVRFAQLAYGRNNSIPARSCLLKSQGDDLDGGSMEAVELQFHGTDDFEKNPHCVVYLYRAEASSSGVGVVLAFKGTTPNNQDWAHNFDFLAKLAGVTRGECPVPDLAAQSSRLPEFEKAKVHPGFIACNRALFNRMQNCSMASLRGVLEEWQAPTTASNILSWLRSADSWKWCILVGHSQGGAMASLAALDLAMHSKGQVLLATMGCPAVGNKAYVRLQNSWVGPGGGLRIFNRGDMVPSLGYSSMTLRPKSAQHGGVEVALFGKVVDQLDSYHIHIRYTVPSSVGSKIPKMVTYKFPGVTYKPNAKENHEECNLGEYWMQDRVMAHWAHAPVPERWQDDVWWIPRGE